MQRTTDSTEESINSPRHLIQATGTVPLWRDRLTLGAELRGLSERRTSLGVTAPGYLVGNLVLHGHDILGRVGLSLGIGLVVGLAVGWISRGSRDAARRGPSV